MIFCRFLSDASSTGNSVVRRSLRFGERSVHRIHGVRVSGATVDSLAGEFPRTREATVGAGERGSNRFLRKRKKKENLGHSASRVLVRFPLAVDISGRPPVAFFRLRNNG